jgi:GTP-binding protein
LKISSLKLACTELDPARFPRSHRREIAVAGRSNVGKSSLLNTILNRRGIARISKRPGKTQTVNFFVVNDRFYLVDLPGYGYAKVSAGTRRAWKRVIFSYIESRRRLAGVVQLIDARHPPSRDDIVMLQHLIDTGRPFLVVFTKADKVRRSERARLIENFRGCFEGGIEVHTYVPGDGAGDPRVRDPACRVPTLFFSAKTGEGKDDIWRWIGEMIA